MRNENKVGLPGYLAGVPLAKRTWLKLPVDKCFTGRCNLFYTMHRFCVDLLMGIFGSFLSKYSNIIMVYRRIAFHSLVCTRPVFSAYLWIFQGKSCSTGLSKMSA